jgi:hypothetical protein
VILDGFSVTISGGPEAGADGVAVAIVASAVISGAEALDAHAAHSAPAVITSAIH